MSRSIFCVAKKKKIFGAGPRNLEDVPKVLHTQRWIPTDTRAVQTRRRTMTFRVLANVTSYAHRSIVKQQQLYCSSGMTTAQVIDLEKKKLDETCKSFALEQSIVEI